MTISSAHNEKAADDDDNDYARVKWNFLFEGREENTLRKCNANTNVCSVEYISSEFEWKISKEEGEMGAGGNTHKKAEEQTTRLLRQWNKIEFCSKLMMVLLIVCTQAPNKVHLNQINHLLSLAVCASQLSSLTEFFVGFSSPSSRFLSPFHLNSKFISIWWWWRWC